MTKRAYVYIDGFNLYNGAVKNTKYKWLDLLEFSKKLLPKDNVIKIKYFTSKVKARGDPNRPSRQKVYWRALKAFHQNKIEIIEGHFQIYPKKETVAGVQNYNNGKITFANKYIWIIRTEEKGSDVSLGVHLVNDAWKDLYDIALIISNDSDLVEAIKISKNELKKDIFISNPAIWRQNRDVAKGLQKISTGTIWIAKNLPSKCQLPENIPGTKIHKPDKWK